jgi:hypothetical protein
MSRILRRLCVGTAAVVAMVFGPLFVTTVVNPAVSWACDWGQVWDAASNSCVGAPPPPPPPPIGPVGPVTWCIGAPIPFVPMSWCVPVGQT